MLDQLLYVDLDDVLCETARAFLILLEAHFGRTAEFEAITAFDLRVSFGLDAAEYERFMRLAHEPQVLRAFEPIDGAQEALREINALGCEVAIVTGRPAYTAGVSRAWLDDHNIPYRELIFVDKYGRAGVHDGPDQAISLDELARIKFCYAVEDSGDMAAFLTTEMQLSVALLERPWNRAYPFPGQQSAALVDRCADWSQIVERLRGRMAD